MSPGTAASIKNGTLIPLGDGKFKLATAPPVPNTNSIAPICPVGFHLALSKCVVNSGGCPSGTIQDDDICSPVQARYNIPSNVAKFKMEPVQQDIIAIQTQIYNVKLIVNKNFQMEPVLMGLS